MLYMMLNQTERLADAYNKTIGSIGVNIDGEPLEILLTIGAAILLIAILRKGAR